MKKVLIWFLSAILLYTLWYFSPLNLEKKVLEIMYNSSLSMEKFLDTLSKYSINADLITDPNRTGLIGSEFTEITTTSGDLQAKRTTTNPDFAALMAYLLLKVGVKEGDCVAIGASGSFPGVIISVLSACKSIGAKPLVIATIGASQWGANNLDFNILDLYTRLVKFGFEPPLFFMYGGSDNTGKDFGDIIRKKLIKKAEEYGFLIKESTGFENDVYKVFNAYFENCNSKISAFVNIGGNLINIGRSTQNARLYGIVNPKNLEDTLGIMNLMSSDQIPVLSFLNIREISVKYRIPWDPIPLPKVSLQRTKELYKNFLLSK